MRDASAPKQKLAAKTNLSVYKIVVQKFDKINLNLIYGQQLLG